MQTPRDARGHILRSGSYGGLRRPVRLSNGHHTRSFVIFPVRFTRAAPWSAKTPTAAGWTVQHKEIFQISRNFLVASSYPYDGSSALTTREPMLSFVTAHPLLALAEGAAEKLESRYAQARSLAWSRGIRNGEGRSVMAEPCLRSDIASPRVLYACD
jgi:hypothetical protein